MTNTKTILLIGRTGNGKSTLANVIVGDNKFGEGAGSFSETKKVSDHVFENKGIKYRIVDTVGIGDTDMSLDKVLRKLALMGYSVKDGLSQILFVTDGQLVREAKSTYDLLEKVVFDDNIANYTTIIRTNFAGFWDESKCEKEKERMIVSSKDFEKLVKECNKIIYVDNPPINIDGYGLLGSLNKKRREDSRKKILEHLKNVCQENIAIYKPENLIKLGNAIGDYEEKKEKLKGKWIDRGKNKILNGKITEKMVEHIKKIGPELKKELREELDQLQSKEKEKKTARWNWFGKKEEISESGKEKSYTQTKISRLKKNKLEKEEFVRIIQKKLDEPNIRDNWETEEGLNNKKTMIKQELEQIESELQSLQNQEDVTQQLQAQIEIYPKK